jgi:hypothetical protein
VQSFFAVRLGFLVAVQVTLPCVLWLFAVGCCLCRALGWLFAVSRVFAVRRPKAARQRFHCRARFAWQRFFARQRLLSAHGKEPCTALAFFPVVSVCTYVWGLWLYCVSQKKIVSFFPIRKKKILFFPNKWSPWNVTRTAVHIPFALIWRIVIESANSELPDQDTRYNGLCNSPTITSIGGNTSRNGTT